MGRQVYEDTVCLYSKHLPEFHGGAYIQEEIWGIWP